MTAEKKEAGEKLIQCNKCGNYRPASQIRHVEITVDPQMAKDAPGLKVGDKYDIPICSSCTYPEPPNPDQ